MTNIHLLWVLAVGNVPIMSHIWGPFASREPEPRCLCMCVCFLNQFCRRVFLSSLKDCIAWHCETSFFLMGNRPPGIRYANPLCTSDTYPICISDVHIPTCLPETQIRYAYPICISGLYVSIYTYIDIAKMHIREAYPVCRSGVHIQYEYRICTSDMHIG